MVHPHGVLDGGYCTRAGGQQLALDTVVCTPAATGSVKRELFCEEDAVKNFLVAVFCERGKI